MQNGIELAAIRRDAPLTSGPLSTDSTQVDEARDVYYQEIAAQHGRRLLDSLSALPEYQPRPGITLGRLRISVTVVDTGLDLGSVELDSVNVYDLATLTHRRAEGLRARLASTARPALYIVRGGR